MKFSAVFFAAGVAASTLVQRQVSTIQSAIDAIGSASEALTTGVNNYAGSSSFAELQSASQNLIDTINKGTEDIAPVGELTLAEALTLQASAEQLTGTVQTATQGAIDKKPQFVADGLGAIIYEQLGLIKEAANKFSSAVVSKVPQAAQGIAQSLIAPINDALDKVVAAYADQEGTGGVVPSAGASSEAAAPTAASSAASAASSAAPTAAASSAAAAPTAASTPAPPAFTGAASANTIGFAAAALALVAAL